MRRSKMSGKEWNRKRYEDFVQGHHDTIMQLYLDAEASGEEFCVMGAAIEVCAELLHGPNMKEDGLLEYLVEAGSLDPSGTLGDDVYCGVRRTENQGE
jgi:hypothetical protein